MQTSGQRRALSSPLLSRDRSSALSTRSRSAPTVEKQECARPARPEMNHNNAGHPPAGARGMAGWRRCPTPLSIPQLCRGNSGTIHPRAGNATPDDRRRDNRPATDIPSDASKTSRPVERKDAKCGIGQHVHPCLKVEGLVLRKRGGSSSLPGRTKKAPQTAGFARSWRLLHPDRWEHGNMLLATWEHRWEHFPRSH
jgi:hypothetical protein